MNRRSSRRNSLKGMIRSIEGLSEIIALCFIYYIVWRLGYGTGIFPAYYGMGKYVLAGVYGLLMLVTFFGFGGFRFGQLKKADVLLSQLLAIFGTNFITYFQLSLIANVLVSPTPIVLLTFIDGVVALLCTLGFTHIYYKLYAPKNMVMIYGRNDALTLKIKMDTRPDKFRIVKLLKVEEGLDAICSQLSAYDAVIINDVPAEIRNDILKFCYRHDIRTYVTPKVTDILVRGSSDMNLFDTPLLLVRALGLSFSQRCVKRALDVVLSVIGTVIASPVMLLTALAIHLEDGGPVFFTQDRVTEGGRVFRILKFRSMIVGAEQAGVSVPATEKDPRITRVGRFIRATRLDELPQLINILKGDMSIVGPRPERVEHMESYCREIPEFDFRLKVKGGLTGYAQIYGKYNTSPYDKLRMDLIYIQNYSLWLDIKLIMQTVRILFQKESTQGFDKTAQLELQGILKETVQEEEK